MYCALLYTLLTSYVIVTYIFIKIYISRIFENIYNFFLDNAARPCYTKDVDRVDKYSSAHPPLVRTKTKERLWAHVTKTMLKHLSDFAPFQFGKFADGKKFVSTGCTQWLDYETKKLLGTKIDLVIIEDSTDYLTKPGETVTNQYEKFVAKIAKTDISVPNGSVVELVNPVAVVFGQYRNQLSVKADDIKVVAPSVPPAKG